jgi:hypothetical protein
MAPPVAPSTDGYFIGKGIIVFKPEGETVFRALGNVPEFEFTPSTDTLDHFSSMAGVKTKDKTVVLSKGGELRIVMEELTANNLAMLVLGSVDNTDPDRPKVNIFDVNAVSGEVRFYATNEIGPKWDGVFSGVDFLPSGSFSPISDEWGQMEVTGQIKTVGGSFGYWQFRPNTAVVPLVIANPTISGTPQVGEVLTAGPGVWLGDPTSYSYAWKANGTPIGGATASTFTLTGAQFGQAITVAVTASNATGAGTASTSAATAVVDDAS